MTQLWMTLLPYLTVAANLLLVLGILLGVSQSVRRLRKQTAARDAALQAENERLTTIIGELRTKMQKLEEGEVAQAQVLAAGGGNTVNGALRTKVLKMHRLGQASGRIADKLRMPKEEIDLMVKVHQLAMQSHEDTTAASGEKR